MNRYNETSVLRSLGRKKGSVSINSNNKTVYVAKDSTDVGNGTWGKIDFLCKVCGYTYMFVNTLSKVKKISTEEEVINTKIAKREHKLDMAKMSKIAMKSNKR